MFTLIPLIKNAYAADPAANVTIGSIVGIGKLGLDDEVITNETVRDQFTGTISMIITSLTVIGGLAFVIFFTLGGLKWLTAGGDKAKVQEAQQQMTQGVIGLVAMVAGLFVVGIVGGVLGIDILNPFSTLMNSIGGSTGGGGTGGGGNPNLMPR